MSDDGHSGTVGEVSIGYVVHDGTPGFEVFAYLVGEFLGLAVVALVGVVADDFVFKFTG